MFQSLSLSDSASSSLLPQTGSRVDGEQPQIADPVQKQVNLQFPSVKQGGDMMKDKGEFQKKLAYLSRVSLQVGRKCLDLQEKIVIQGQQITLLRHQNTVEKAFSQSLLQQKNKLQLALSQLQFQLQNKQSLSEAPTILQQNSCHSDYQEILQTQRRHLQEVSQERQQLYRQNQQQKLLIEKLAQQISKMQIEVNSRDQALSKAQLNQNQFLEARAKLKSANEDLSDAKKQIQLLRNQNNQLQKQAIEMRRLCGSVSQVQLAALGTEEELLGLREECRFKSLQLKKIERMYRDLQQRFEKVRRERDFLKDHHKNLSEDKSEVEHILIDKFVLALVIMRSKLQSADVDNVSQCMDLQKKAIFCRLDMQYRKVMQ